MSAIVDHTRAYLDNADFTSSGGDLELHALNDTQIFQGAGAVVYATVTNGNGSQGLAGSLAINFITSTTETFIQNSSIDLTGSLEVDADSKGTIIGVAFSGSGSGR